MAETKVGIIIEAEDRASQTIKKVTGSVDSLKPSLQSMAVVGTAAFAALTAIVYQSIAAFEESEKVQAQLEAVLNSTAHAAGVSADEAIKLSKSLEAQTTFSDEAVLSAENLLLTFTKIKDSVFPEATKTVLDMATALGEDTSSAAIQLGKALNDPILGVTALQRVGVSFSAAQKEVIQHLVETGHTLEAQKMILKELSTEFGGSATAAAKTFGGQVQQLKNKFDDFEETIGHGVTGALSALMIAFNQTTGAAGDETDASWAVFAVTASLGEVFADAAVGVTAFFGFLAIGASVILEVAADIATLGTQVGKIHEMFGGVRQSASDAIDGVGNFALNLHDQNQKMSADWDKITTDSKKYGATAQEAYQQTAEAAKAAADKVKEVNKDIADTAAKLADLIEGHENSVADTRRSAAEAYVAEQQNIQDLRKRMADTQDFTERQALEREITQNEAALATKASMTVDYANEIAEANRRARETDFERTLEDIARRQAEDQKQFEKKRLAIYQEMALEDQKLKAITVGETAVTTHIAGEMKKQVEIVTAAANDSVIQAQRVQSAWASAFSVTSGAVKAGSPTFSGFANSTPATIHDGIVQNGEVITTDPDDYIIATKTPETLGSGGRSINININGAVFSQEAARTLGDLILGDLRLQMKGI